ncbi:Gag-Pol polyprotein [Gossypium arboreum]|uniref:Gag-Pol polyprotein n=1 Tax=Gossypium arboreum TaxID=29729 RepID=A0A0B0MRU6_GOSAR|nr:Gag-Pol polyprotein [Gossypium arboreum]
MAHGLAHGHVVGCVTQQMDHDRAVVDDVESNAPAAAQGAVQSNSRLVSSSQRGEAKQAFFQLMLDDGAERAEFWLENTIRVFDESSCTPDECIKCVRFLDQKHKEFLELKQGRMAVTEYEREFVQLSTYAQEYVSTEEIMCKQFVHRLNEDIKLLVGILELKEFVVLVERACKAEDLNKEKRKADFEARDSRKRTISKYYLSESKKFQDSFSHSNTSVGHSNRDRVRQQSSFKAPATSITSVESARPNLPECKHCGKRHLGDCRLNDRACFKCGSLDHFIRDCQELVEQDTVQNTRLSNTATKGRPPRNIGNVCGGRGVTQDTTAISDARAPAGAYTICAREEALSLDGITGIFTIYDTKVIALIDPGSTHSLPKLAQTRGSSGKIITLSIISLVWHGLDTWACLLVVCGTSAGTWACGRPCDQFSNPSSFPTAIAHGCVLDRVVQVSMYALFSHSS